jgi:hypothetical protein
MGTMFDQNTNLIEQEMEIESHSISSESSEELSNPPPSEEVRTGAVFRLPTAHVVIPKGLASFLSQKPSSSISNQTATVAQPSQDDTKLQDFQTILKQFLGPQEIITTTDQMKTFIKAMKKAEKEEDKQYILKVLGKLQNENIWKEFYGKKGPLILFNWASTFGLSNDSNSGLFLSVVRKLPYNEEVFKEYPFHKFVNRVIKNGSKGLTNLM